MVITKEMKKALRANGFNYGVIRFSTEKEDNGYFGEIILRGSKTREKNGIAEEITSQLNIPLEEGSIFLRHNKNGEKHAAIHFHNSDVESLKFFLSHVSSSFYFELWMNNQGSAIQDLGCVQHSFYGQTDNGTERMTILEEIRPANMPYGSINIQ